ncbi:universal stress protein [uncultured Porticoccus sp.]|uniref:universal stress protein n=1 Tax=uncultured Porticoccus sp. TaxID=1256050 RepID=UPI0030D8B8A3|tara:strand:+ start:2496 stop:2924 length:429 start_codon:yes stop_codon:yes gene_type:complete
MSAYKHILIGLDLSPESQQVVERVKSLFGNGECQLSLVHVQEPLSFAYGGDIPMDLTEVQYQLEEQAKQRLTAIGKDLGVPIESQHVIIGQPAQEMHRFANDNNVDLIIVGSHGRHGISLILGSTATGVLHGSQCDVLAVRV